MKSIILIIDDIKIQKHYLNYPKLISLNLFLCIADMTMLYVFPVNPNFLENKVRWETLIITFMCHGLMLVEPNHK